LKFGTLSRNGVRVNKASQPLPYKTANSNWMMFEGLLTRMGLLASIVNPDHQDLWGVMASVGLGADLDRMRGLSFPSTSGF
jgi:hypothetical protein